VGPGTCMAGRRRQGTGRLAAVSDKEALLRSPLMPPSSSSSSSMAALEEGKGKSGAAVASSSSSSLPSPKAAPADRYHLAYIIFYLQVR
jgi:hypothetical protein